MTAPRPTARARAAAPLPTADRRSHDHGHDDTVRVLHVTLDSLAPDEVGPQTPTLLELQSQGTWYEQARGVMASETLPNHVAIGTGTYPGRNGIPGNSGRVAPGDTTVADPDLGDPAHLQADSFVDAIEQVCPDLRTVTVLSKAYVHRVFLDDRRPRACGNRRCSCSPPTTAWTTPTPRTPGPTWTWAGRWRPTPAPRGGSSWARTAGPGWSPCGIREPTTPTRSWRPRARSSPLSTGCSRPCTASRTRSTPSPTTTRRPCPSRPSRWTGPDLRLAAGRARPRRRRTVAGACAAGGLRPPTCRQLRGRGRPAGPGPHAHRDDVAGHVAPRGDPVAAPVTPATGGGAALAALGALGAAAVGVRMPRPR